MANIDTGLIRPGSRQLTIVATLLSMIAPFSINTYLPSFPDIEAEFGITRVVLSQSLAVYLLAFAISTLFWGPLADRFGRRPVIVVSMTAYVLASVGCQRRFVRRAPGVVQAAQQRTAKSRGDLGG